MQTHHCRLCESRNIVRVIDLGQQPLADTFPKFQELEDVEIFPLEVALCHDCGHLFTLHKVSPSLRYQHRDYCYDSANSKVSMQHFRSLYESIVALVDIQPSSRIIEIGSNVGTLLKNFSDSGYLNVLGIDPSKNIGDIARNNGIPTISEFFNIEVANRILSDGPADLILATNVLNHVEDVHEFLSLSKALLAKNGSLVIEVPCAETLMKKNSFDTIYHEHVHYFSLKTVSNCLAKHGFKIQKINRLEYMGGSLRVFATHGDEAPEWLAQEIQEQERRDLFSSRSFANFRSIMNQEKTSVREFINSAKAMNTSIIGIGAASKGNTYLHFCGITNKDLSYIAEQSPLKIGRYTPGSGIPIRAESDIDSSITHAIILPWNISGFLSTKLSKYNLKLFTPHKARLNGFDQTDIRT